MNRRGFTLLLVLLAVVALELLTLSSLALSTHEQVVASTQLRTFRARRQADAALRRLIAAWPALMDSTAVGERRTVLDSAGMKLEIERYSWGTLELIASVQAGTHAQQRSLLLRSLDAQRAFHEMNDALISAGPLELSGSTVSVDDAGGCTLPFEAERAARSLTVARPEYAGLADAVTDSTYASAPPGYALGGVRWSEVAAIADTVVNGSIVLSDTAEGGSAKLLYAPGDLVIMGGRARGLLMVQGNLQMRAAEFAGIVMVGGTLDADHAGIAGSVRIQGIAPSRIVDSELAYRHCAIASGLLEAAAMRRLIRGGRRLIPTF